MSEKIEAFWENATADDVAKIIKTGKPIPARVRDEEGDSWLDDSFLQGWINGNWAARGAYWTFCQVYREPSWYANKPDPGPGFRLLEKFPDEPKLGTDEAWRGKSWRRVLRDDGKQEPSGWYRRRIEPVEPVENKPVLIRRWTVDPGDEIKLPNGRLLIINQDGFEVKQ
jgi:hypothetical protein